MWQAIGRGLVRLGALVLVGSFAGDLHGLGDSLAVFRPVIVIGCLAVCALVWRWRGARIVALAAALVGLWIGSVHLVYPAPDGAGDVVVYQKNLLYRPAERGPFIADVQASGADFVMLQEVSGANVPVLEALRGDYPHQLLCNGHPVGAVAILSRTPLEQEDCGTLSGFARVDTVLDGREVRVYSLHLHWPWPHGQASQVADLVGDMPKGGPLTIVAGDFNMVASGRSLARIARQTGTERVGPFVRTFDLFGYPLGIDHVLATGGIGALSVRPKLGSDHYGLIARIDWPSAP